MNKPAKTICLDFDAAKWEATLERSRKLQELQERQRKREHLRRLNKFIRDLDAWTKEHSNG